MPRIVLSYRRDDSQAATHYLYDRLRQHFGRESVFLDFDSIPYGVDFRDHIASVLHECDVMLAMIGARWRMGSSGRSRLVEDNDWVRYEIEQAFADGIWVVPVLLDGASMPRAAQMPESIRKLVYLNAIQVDTGKSFENDTATLVRALEQGIAAGTLHRKERLKGSGVGDAAAVSAPSLTIKAPDEKLNKARPSFLTRSLPSGRFRPLVLLAVAGLLLVGGAGAYFYLRSSHESPSAAPSSDATTPIPSVYDPDYRPPAAPTAPTAAPATDGPAAPAQEAPSPAAPADDASPQQEQIKNDHPS